MKASFRIGDGGANHIDRSYKAKNDRHDPERRPDNVVMAKDLKTRMFKRIPQSRGLCLKIEKAIYARLYGERLRAQNEKHIKSGHKKRTMTMHEMYSSPKYKPHELILQIGNENEDQKISKDELQICLSRYIDHLEKYEENMTIMSFAIHMDETTPHVHIRYTMHSKDHECSVTKALDEMGFKKGEKVDRHHNPTVDFTAHEREIWYQTVEQTLGLTIDREVKNPSVKHKTTLQHEVEELEKKKAALREDISKDVQKAQNELQELQAIENLTNDVKERIRADISHWGQDTIQERCAMAEEYIDAKGLKAEFQQFQRTLEEKTRHHGISR